MKKIALCLYGQPRWVQLPYQFNAYKRWILSKYNVDVFTHFWLSDDSENFNYGDWSVGKKYNCKYVKNSKEIIIEKYNPLKFKFEKAKKFELDENSRKLVKNLKWYSLNTENALLSHLYSMSESINLIDDIKIYDFIIVSRYDTFIINFPDLNQLDNNRLYLSDAYLDFSDQLVMGGPNQMKTQALFDKIPLLCGMVTALNPENFKQQSFELSFDNQNILRIPMRFGYIRNHSLNSLQL